MSDDSRLVPLQTESAQMVTTLATPNQATIAAIRGFVADEHLPRSVRRKLVRQELSGLLQKREQQLAAALAIEAARIAAVKEISAATFTKEKREYLLVLENDYVAVVSELGVRVAMAKLRCMDEFDRQLTVFCRQLSQTPDHDPERKEFILKAAKEAFYGVCDMLGAIAANQIVKLQADDS